VRPAVVLLVLASLGTGCKEPPAAKPPEPFSAPIVQPPVEQGEIWGPQDEHNTRVVRRIFHDALVAETGDDSLMRRDAHPKHHACVRARLEVDTKRLRPDYRHGLFAQDGEYEAWVRFSNGDSDRHKDDDEPNFRGMAIKVMKVPYRSYLSEVGLERDNPVHDLVLLNSPTFFIGDTTEYAEFMRAVAKGGLALAGFSMRHGENIKIIQKSRKMKVGNVLDVDYHSATPYKLGSTSMRMQMHSCTDVAHKRPRRPSPNFLAERLEASLAQGEHCFVFYLQPNEDPERNPIEDPLRSWDLETSPLVEVGRLTVLQQTGARAPDQQAMCEHLSFNPWRAPSANRPMGQANRVRLEVYTNQAKLRHDHNEAEEPRPLTLEIEPATR